MMMRAPPIPPPTAAVAATARARYLTFGAVFFVFLLLGVAAAYTHGGSAQDATLRQSQLAGRRLDSVRARLSVCERSTDAIRRGANLTFDSISSHLQGSIRQLRGETVIMQEMAADSQRQQSSCQEQLEEMRRSRTGAGDGDGAAEVQKLRFDLSRLRSAVSILNRSRMADRAHLLRLVEAYSRENAALGNELRRQQLAARNELRDVLNITT